jgi:transcriptional regulator with XRE-family HTH domain
VKKQRLLNKVGKRIVELRKQKNLSQRQLAFLSGKDPQSLERVENGKINPTIFYLYEISQALGVSLNELIDF